MPYRVLLRMARPERFELPTSWFVAMRSIQLSYGRSTEVAGGESRPSLKAAAGALTCVSRSRQRGHVWAETVPGAFRAARARDLFLSRISKLPISA
jgi:hypothetical protein